MNLKIILLLGIVLMLSACTNTGVFVDDNNICDPVDSAECATVDKETLYVKDYLDSGSLGQIDGVNMFVLSSHNPDVDDSGSREDIWETGGLLVYLNTSETLNIVSDSAEDGINGTGMRNVLVSCLDGNLTLINQIITMNGTTNVTTPLGCLRPRLMLGLIAGDTQENQGTVTATSSVTGNIQMEMGPLEGTTKNSQITVPANTTAIIKKVIIGATKSGGQAPIVEVKGKIRFLNRNIWIQTFDFKLDTSVSDLFILDNPISNELPAGTDFRIEVTSSIDNTDVLARTFFIFEED